MSVADPGSEASRQSDYSDRPYPVVYLNESEIQRCYELARERDSSKDGRGYLDEDQNSFMAHFRGVQGELAVAKWYGVEDTFDDEIYEDEGDDGVDLEIARFGVDVKTTPYDETGRLLMDQHHVYEALDDPEKTIPDAFYLVEEIEKGVLGLVGWCTLAELLDREPRKWPRDTLNYVVERDELRDFHEKRGDARTESVDVTFDTSFESASGLAD
ncbi:MULTISPECIES: hypothetical protein [Halorussus]|uniref:Restriction endonuclease n=2 Tax=Halorussus TaxID=1070314 RepID=A0A8U0HVE6_9EURY|nr:MULTISPECIES: hypothetical protein [Halorussus]UPV74594.1 hypothetical protein M0R89_00650 [Halorussus limi]